MNRAALLAAYELCLRKEATLGRRLYEAVRKYQKVAAAVEEADKQSPEVAAKVELQIRLKDFKQQKRCTDEIAKELEPDL